MWEFFSVCLHMGLRTPMQTQVRAHTHSFCHILYTGCSARDPRLSGCVCQLSESLEPLKAGLVMASGAWGDMDSVCMTEPALCTSSSDPPPPPHC